MATRTTSARSGTASGGKSGSSTGRGSGSSASKTGRGGGSSTARTRQLPAVEHHQPWLLKVVGGAWLGLG
ncbi:hypothetical protein, partial [Escherichia coli]|uniref:hypothetical protein n=1 Tax=Escherichia coli TaxID=562 RepID=UPI0032E4C244